MRFSNKMHSPIGTKRNDRGTVRQRIAVAALCALPLASCDNIAQRLDSQIDNALSRTTRYTGTVVAEEPAAALAGHDILTAGGNAADAAVATAFALSVTLPSQAGLGGGGSCMVYNRNKRLVERLDFVAPAKHTPVPAMARGLYALYAKYGGRLSWDQLVAPAEKMARQGQPVSRALAQRLAAMSGGPAPFVGRDGQALKEGDDLRQPALAATLGQIRTKQVGVLYDGHAAVMLAGSYAALLPDAPSSAEISAFLPEWHEADKIAFHDDSVFLPKQPMAVGEGRLWSDLLAKENGESDPEERLAPLLDFYGKRTPPAQAASTGFVTIGRDGSAVACDFSMGTMFGSGRTLADYGFLPASGPLPPLQPIIAIDEKSNQFRFALAAPPARAGDPSPEGLAAASCGSGKLDAESCRAWSDPKGAGLAVPSGRE